MLAVSPQFSGYGWLLEDPISHEQVSANNYYYLLSTEEKTPTSESIDLHSPSSQAKNGEFSSFFDGLGYQGDGNKIFKKLNHNASERDRRKKINTLYTTLRSLLPQDDQSRKLSIPATIAEVLKYIPELQKEVERLVKKKESYMSKISSTQKESSQNNNFRGQDEMKLTQRSLSAITVTPVTPRELVIQISVPKVEKVISVSEAIQSLEHEGFIVLSASCFESSQGRVFHNLHLQAQGNEVMDAEILKEKMWLVFEEADEITIN